MKYVLVKYRIQISNAYVDVDERYYRKYDENETSRRDWDEKLTLKLSLAKIWNTLGEVEDYREEDIMNDYKIVHITEKHLFQARLNAK